MYFRYTFFCQIATFIKVHVALVFGLQTLLLKDFSKIYQLKGMKSKNKGHTNFYECCDLTEKDNLMYISLVGMVPKGEGFGKSSVTHWEFG